MIRFDQIEAPFKVDEQFILSKLDDVQIFYYYFGRFEIRTKTYPSVFRKDKNPSTGFYIAKDGRIIYNDLTTGEKLNCFRFVAKLFNISYFDALDRIAIDFGLIKSATAKPLAEKIINETLDFDKESKRKTEIQVSPGVWQNHHIKYWNDYCISVDELKKNKVYPVKRLFINKAEQFGMDELCFAYVVEEVVHGKIVNTYLKIYQPHKKGQGKWISNVPLTVPFGLADLKYGTDHALIGKAQKDRMILLKFFQSVIGTQNESESALHQILIKHLKFHFPRLTIIWDADKTGVDNCMKFNSKGFGYFNTPKNLLEQGIKDISDYVKAFGLDALEKLLREKNIL